MSTILLNITLKHIFIVNESTESLSVKSTQNWAYLTDGCEIPTVLLKYYLLVDILCDIMNVSYECVALVFK